VRWSTSASAGGGSTGVVRLTASMPHMPRATSPPTTSTAPTSTPVKNNTTRPRATTAILSPSALAAMRCLTSGDRVCLRTQRADPVSHLGGPCYGWISGQRRSFDARYYLQRYVPRRPGSLWSKVNIAKVEWLLEAGRMKEPGMAEVRSAQADGRWDAAYESQRNAIVPPELVAALDDSPKAKEFFDSLDRSAQYRLYLPVLQARSPKTRAARAR